LGCDGKDGNLGRTGQGKVRGVINIKRKCNGGFVWGKFSGNGVVGGKLSGEKSLGKVNTVTHDLQYPTRYTISSAIRAKNV